MTRFLRDNSSIRGIAFYVLSIGPMTGCGERVELSFSAAPGDTWLFTVVERVRLSTEGMSVATTVSTQEIRVTVDAWDAATGVWRLTGLYERFDSTESALLAGIEVDDDTPTPRLDAAIGQSFTFEIHPSGSVQNMRGNTEIVRAMVEDLGLPARELIDMRRDLEFAYGDLAMTRNMQLFLPGTGHSIRPGRQWNRSIDGGLATMQNTYNLKGRGNGSVSLDLEVRTTGDKRGDGLPLGATSVTVNGRGSGTVEVDSATGVVREQRMRLNDTNQLIFPDGSSLVLEGEVEHIITGKPI